MIKFKNARDGLLFVIGSLGMIATLIAILYAINGCATTQPGDSFEACTNYCALQHKKGAFITVLNGVEVQQCKCYSTFEELEQDVLTLLPSPQAVEIK